ncbi:uncharacterized protein BXIN_2725 [Babesia sp. Xinjiang]|uniref:uncharacterized protein n=1 Tax=Babesia sp. Xinjiang TaxID=462227 RepID=UPI000A2550FD|nr:uncharacterized protein BXIN_2725 [Babesia sp. Xinjiang]ORM41695.1 hypothetical protein BXIN_2725 [Babesia sp. Xinjiang]
MAKMGAKTTGLLRICGLGLLLCAYSTATPVDKPEPNAPEVRPLSTETSDTLLHKDTKDDSQTAASTSKSGFFENGVNGTGQDLSDVFNTKMDNSAHSLCDDGNGDTANVLHGTTEERCMSDVTDLPTMGNTVLQSTSLSTDCEGTGHQKNSHCHSGYKKVHNEAHQRDSLSTPKEANEATSTCCASKNGTAESSHEMMSTCGMAAYFENTYKSVILFHFWKTTTAMEYFVSLLFIFVLSLFTVFLKALRKMANMALLSRNNTWPYALKQLAMFSIAFAVVFMDFSMMLIVMTFNVGIVLVVCTGYALGYMLTCFTFVLPEDSCESRCSVECVADCC